MAQIYFSSLSRLLRSLLLQCVILLGIVSVGLAQEEAPQEPAKAQLPINYDGPWSGKLPQGWTQDGTIIAGQDLEGGSQGSAQFRSSGAYIDIHFKNASSTDFKLSYSLQAVTTRPGYTATFTVSYSTDGGGSYIATDSANAITPSRTAQRISDRIPRAATNIRFTLNSVSQAYVLLDALELVQTPEVVEVTPVSGVPGTAVTITGHRLNGASVKFGDLTVPAELVVKDEQGNTSTVTGVTINPEGTEIIAYVPYGAVASSPITVRTDYGTTATAPVAFSVPAPIFDPNTPFTPITGIAGESVVLNGSNFIDAREVLFNGAAATFVVDHNGKITATIPNLASSGPIKVITPAGSVESRSFDVPKPAIIARNVETEDGEVEFTPTTGKALTTTVTIFGAYFHNVTKVEFNGVEAQDFTVNDTDDEITVTVPLGASTGLITVTSPAGTATSTTSFNLPAPKFVAREVTAGDVTAKLEFNPARTGAGKTITIYGENLASVSRVVFPGGAEGNGVNGTNLVKNTDTELTVTVPAGAATGKLQLIADGYAPVESSQMFEFVPAPVIADVTPIYGIVTTEITIKGSNFQDATSVKIGNGEIASGFTVNAEGTEIKLSIPVEATTGTVSVTTRLGGTGTWSGTFDVILAPTITAFTPTEGPIAQEITLTGTNLKYVTEVVFLGADNTEDEDDTRVTFATPNSSESELTFNVPAGTPAGLTRLLVRNAADDFVSAKEFEVVLRPVVNTLTPAMGIAGAAVVLDGYNFSNATSIDFGGQVIGIATEGTAGFTVNEAGTQITVAVPADARVLSTVVVTNEFGNSETKDFIVIKKPAIESFVQERGIVGDDVIITGANFYRDANNPVTVSFAGAEDRVDGEITAITPTQVTVKVPAGAITGSLIVTNAAGPSDASETDYIVATTPEIFSFTETSGKVGDEVTITGWLMQKVTHVAFNGITVSVTPSTDGRTIKVKVPEGATTGRLALFEGENPVFTTAEGVVFTVIPAPTILAVSPDRGVGGTEVIITGTNFIDITSVTFNGIEVDEDDIEVNETFDVLKVKVPDAAKTGDIIVTADAGTVTHKNFIVPTPDNITFAPAISYANQVVTIRGQYFTNASEVDFNGKKITTGITVVDAEGEESTNPARFQLITVKAPFDAGIGKITVTTPAGTGVSADNYTVREPKITNISATEGYADQTILTITGELFTQYWNGALSNGEGGEDVKAPIVKFNGAQVEATDYNEDGTSITVKVPGSARSGSVTVVSGSGESEPMQFNVLAPVLSSVAPAAVYAGQTVTITGTNFIKVSGMAYGDIPITGYNVVLTDQEKGTGTITFVAPKINHNTTNTLSVTSSSGTGSTTALTIYRPVISNVFETGKESPADRRIYAGVNTITIKGTRFDEYWGDAKVATERPALSLVRTSTNGAVTEIADFNFTPGKTETDGDEIVATIPTGITAGTYFVRVGSKSGTGQSSDPAGTITVIGTPTISNLSKVVGREGDTFVINGTYFDDATKVTFLGIDGEKDEVEAGFVRTSDTQLTVTVPQGATIGKIAVTTPFGGGEGTTVVSSQIFRVVKAPIVYDFVEKRGPVGSIVTITGENLIAVDGRIKVSFKGHGGNVIPAPLASQIELSAVVNKEDLTTARSITVTVPANAITGVITLTNEVGTTTTAQAKDSDGIYTVTSPVVIRFEKTNGSIITVGNHARLLETVIVKGYNLFGVQRLEIGGTSVFGYYEEDQHTLEMVVPSTTPRSGIVTVTTVVGKDASEGNLEIVRPVITVDPKVLSFKAVTEVEGEKVYDVKTYRVEATNLAVDADILISLSATTPYQLFDPSGGDSGEGAWTTAMRLKPDTDANGNLVQTISVRSKYTIEVNDESEQITVLARHTSVGISPSVNVTLQAEIVPLPVELIAFNARKEGNGVLLTWATASELDNDYFEVQMTEDMKSEFKTVGKVKSKVGTSSIRQDYQFNHRGNFTGTRYYRLKQVDFDGTSDYSRVVAVSSSGADLTAGPKVYPNPITSDSKLAYNAETEGKLQVRVVNMSGTTVHNQSYDIEAGENTIMLNLNNNLPTGIYILMTEFNGKVQQVKLLKQ